MAHDELVSKLNAGLFDLTPSPMILIKPRVFAKLECCNNTGSVKDRFVFSVVKDAVLRGVITSQTVLIEATSGNTGISLAAAGAALGLRVKIVMPCNMSDERKQLLKLFGAEIIEVGPSDFQEAIKVRNDTVFWNIDHWSPMQFENRYNVDVHAKVTGPEIYTQMKDMFGITSWDFISGAGTGGTLMGLYEFLTSQNKTKNVDNRTIQVAPAEPAELHGIQGINDGADFLLDPTKLHDRFLVSTEDAKLAATDFAKTHGLLVGISSGANVVAALKYADAHPKRNVVTLLCDRGERYFSVL